MFSYKKTPTKAQVLVHFLYLLPTLPPLPHNIGFHLASICEIEFGWDTRLSDMCILDEWTFICYDVMGKSRH